MAAVEDARQAIVTKVEALRTTYADPSLVVEYDNRNLVNKATQTAPYLCVEIMNISGDQIDLGPGSRHRVMGSIILTARVRKGAGVKAANELLAAFYPSMHMTDSMIPVRTRAARLVRAKDEGDWAGESAVIPFWYDN